MIDLSRSAADRLDRMRKDVVVLEGDDGIGDDSARLVTMDSKIAEKYGLIDESEYWEGEDDRPDGSPPYADSPGM